MVRFGTADEPQHGLVLALFPNDLWNRRRVTFTSFVNRRPQPGGQGALAEVASENTPAFFKFQMDRMVGSSSAQAEFVLVWELGYSESDFTFQRK